MYNSLYQNEFFLLNAARVSLGSGWNYQNVISPFYRLYYIVGGRGKVALGKEELSLKPGYLYLIPSFSLSHYSCPDFLDQYYLHFEEIMTKGLPIKVGYHVSYEVKATEADDYLFTRLLEINPARELRHHNPKILSHMEAVNPYDYCSESSACILETRGIILQLLSRFIGNDRLPARVGSAHYVRISKTLQYIYEHLSEALTVAKLASVARLNADYFSRIFQEIIGMRPIPYIHQLRVQKAQHLLLFTDASQDEVADAVGFGNRTYFAKIFKELTGQTVGQYRIQPREV